MTNTMSDDRKALIAGLRAWHDHNGHLMPPNKGKLLKSAIAALSAQPSPDAAQGGESCNWCWRKPELMTSCKRCNGSGCEPAQGGECGEVPDWNVVNPPGVLHWLRGQADAHKKAAETSKALGFHSNARMYAGYAAKYRAALDALKDEEVAETKVAAPPFEKWYRAEFPDKPHDFSFGRCYEDDDVYLAHEAWQAAIAWDRQQRGEKC